MLLLCLKIFFARIFDVSLSTVRTIFVIKNKSIYATIIAFIEVIIWFMVAKEALIDAPDSIIIPIAYSAGYATGTLIGSFIADRFIDGYLNVQVISSKITLKNLEKIKNKGYAITNIQLKSENSKKKMFFIETKKTRYNDLIKLIKKFDNNSFIIVNETKHIENGFFK